MRKLILKEKKKYSYVFEDNGNKVEMILEFQCIDLDLQIGDIIYFHKDLVKNNEFYCFGPIGEKYAKKNMVDCKEIIKIVTSCGEFYLQRFYG